MERISFVEKKASDALLPPEGAEMEIGSPHFRSAKAQTTCLKRTEHFIATRLSDLTSHLIAMNTQLKNHKQSTKPHKASSRRR